MADKIKSDPFDSMFQRPAKKEVAESKPTPAVAPKKVEKKQEVVTNAPESAEAREVKFMLQTLSMSQEMADWLIDRANELKRGEHRFGGANRSSIARYAISKLQEQGLDHEEFMDFVLKEQGKK